MLKQVEVIAPFVQRYMLCGSRVTCNPAPTDTDQDVIVLVRAIQATANNTGLPSLVKEYKSISRALEASGFVVGGSGEDDDDFESWSEGGPDNVNLILTADLDFYEKFVTATTVCRQLNIMGKNERQMLFQAMLYGVRPYQPGADGQPYASPLDDEEFP